MLEIRPACEHCNTALAPNSPDARICSFECTFCASCVEKVLHNVCPNCGGGFEKRPVRPSKDWKNGNTLGRHPAGSVARHRPVDPASHASLLAAVGALAPEDR